MSYRIKLFNYLADKRNTYLNGPVLIKAPRKRRRVNFILDTGSPETILGYRDALSLQIPFNSLSKGRIFSFAGRKFQGYTYNKIKMAFISTENKLIEESMPISVIRPTSFKEVEEVDNIPTIIGTDFLRAKRYILYCDISGDNSYLQKKLPKKSAV